mgnify:CR=1 FL=1|jgi:hypothetical protein
MPKLKLSKKEKINYQAGAHFVEDPLLFTNTNFDRIFLKSSGSRDTLA